MGQHYANGFPSAACVGEVFCQNVGERLLRNRENHWSVLLWLCDNETFPKKYLSTFVKKRYIARLRTKEQCKPSSDSIGLHEFRFVPLCSSCHQTLHWDDFPLIVKWSRLQSWNPWQVVLINLCSSDDCWNHCQENQMVEWQRMRWIRKWFCLMFSLKEDAVWRRLFFCHEGRNYIFLFRPGAYVYAVIFILL